jgi:HSP20 family protein
MKASKGGRGAQGRRGYLLKERRHGSFRRAMTLPEGVDESKISAAFKDGVVEAKVRDGAIEIEG